MFAFLWQLTDDRDSPQRHHPHFPLATFPLAEEAATWSSFNVRFMMVECCWRRCLCLCRCQCHCHCLCCCCPTKIQCAPAKANKTLSFGEALFIDLLLLCGCKSACTYVCMYVSLCECVFVSVLVCDEVVWQHTHSHSSPTHLYTCTFALFFLVFFLRLLPTFPLISCFLFSSVCYCFLYVFFVLLLSCRRTLRYRYGALILA